MRPTLCPVRLLSVTLPPLALLLPLLHAGDGNVLANGGFEDELDGWNAFDTTGQGRIEATRDARDAREGKRVLVLERAGGSGVVMVRQDLPPSALAEEVEVRVSYRSPTGGRAQVSLWGYDGENDRPVLDRELVGITGKVRTWKRAEARVKVPEKVVKLSFAIRALDDGIYVFDGAELLAPDAAASGPLLNGDFERGLVGWTAETPSGRATVSTPAAARKSGKQGLRLEREASCRTPWDEVLTELTPLPKKAFSIEAQLRAQGTTAVLELRWYDERRFLLEAEEIGKSEKKSWSKARRRLKPPREARFAELAFRVTGRGHADLDGVVLK